MADLSEAEIKLNKQRATWRREYQNRKEYYKQRRLKKGPELNAYRRQYRRDHLAEAAEYARQKRADGSVTPSVRTKAVNAGQKPVKPVEIPQKTPEEVRSSFARWRAQKLAAK